MLAVDLGPQPEIVYAGPRRAGVAPLRVRRSVVVPEGRLSVLREIVTALGDDRREAARAAVGYREATGPASGVELFGTRVEAGPAIAARLAPEPADMATLEGALEAACARAALVVVALHHHHWDPAWGRTPAWLHGLACGLIDKGADMVVGTGAPVLQPIAFHGGRPILAGLGNFVFHTRRPDAYDREGVPVWTGVVCHCVFELPERACVRVELLPVAVGRPPAAEGEPAPGPAALASAEAGEVLAMMTAGLGPEERARVTVL